jgi:hypothetical protein
LADLAGPGLSVGTVDALYTELLRRTREAAQGRPPVTVLARRWVVQRRGGPSREGGGGPQVAGTGPAARAKVFNFIETFDSRRLRKYKAFGCLTPAETRQRHRHSLAA